MKRYVLLINILVSIFTTSVYTSNLYAGDQVYFIAKPGVEGAASRVGQTREVVYLRWDVVEGTFPADMHAVQLTRNGQVLGEWPIHQTLTETEIYQVFSRPNQQQRLLQLITLLKELALSDVETGESTSQEDFGVNDYAPELLRRIQGNVFWSHFAARSNMGVAMVRNRAYVDYDVVTGEQYEYQLHAVSNTQQIALIGKTSVTVGSTHGLLGVNNLRQLPVATQCDSTQDHFTVALDWLPAGKHVTDQAANNIQLAGYEIYRSVSDLGNEPTPRDLSAEARTLPHNGRGEVEFSGLERVNPTLLMLDGDGTDNPEYVEARNTLSMAGLQPGDRRTYYVVGRDFAGHYGETRSVVVQVPRSLPPVTPWNLESAFIAFPEAGVQLSWDSVNVDNFRANNITNNSQNSAGFSICNADEAQHSGLIEYTQTTQQQCREAFTARVDIAGYRVYRFASFEQARGFKDSDGDGVSDKDEYELQSQCDANTTPSGSVSYAVDDAHIAVQDGPQERRVLLDRGEHLREGTYYWYRIASFTADGKYSLPTRAMRVLVPDLSAPSPPAVDVTRAVDQVCCEITAVDRTQSHWSFNDTIGKHSIVLTEGDTQSGTVSPQAFGSHTSRVCMLPGQLDEFWGTREAHGLPRTLVYIDDKKDHDISDPYCTAEIPAELDLCRSGAWMLTENVCSQPQVIQEGEVTEGKVTVSLTTEDASSCIEYYDTIAGQETLLHTSCGTETPGALVFDVENDAACGRAVTRDRSGNMSVPAVMPCTVAVAEAAISPPQLLSLDASADTLTFSWRTPLQLTASTLIEVRSDAGDENTQILTFPSEGLVSGQHFEDQTAVIHALLTGRDQWCIRAIAVGPQTNGGSASFSEWSASLCKTRRQTVPGAVEYLPWPKITPLPPGQPLRVELAKDFVSEAQGQEIDKLSVLIHFGKRSGLFSADNPLCQYEYTGNDRQIDTSRLFFTKFHCGLAGKTSIDTTVTAPFMVYRQARSPEGTLGLWNQVSPLKPRVDWTSSSKLGQVLRYQLTDRNIVFYRHIADLDPHGSDWHVAYHDHYPYISGYDYRYQLVTFNDKHAIASWRMSDWVSPGVSFSVVSRGE